MIRTKITAHRGYCKEHQENTLPAFLSAIDLGCERIELDIHLTKDKKLVVHHDYYVRTITNINKPIHQITLAEMGSEIPLLDEVLEILNDRIELEIELKGFSIDFAESIILKIAQNGTLKRMEFTSPHPFILSYLRTKYMNLKLGMFVPKFFDGIPKDIVLQIIVGSMNIGNVDVAHLSLDRIDKELVEVLHDQGKLVHVANCNTRENLKEAFQLGVDQLSTDELELALSIRNSLL